MILTNNLMEQSMEEAIKILNKSRLIREAGVDSSLYVEREQYLKDLLGEEGYISFHPNVEKDLTADFQKQAQPLVSQKHDIYLNEHRYEEERRAYNDYSIASKLLDDVTNEHLLNNTIPGEVTTFIKRRDIKGLSSPKLSKLLVKIFGETSEVVKWYTNKCPKKLEKGVIKNYKVHLSILPHHIAGMSYYAPYNWGGEKWVTGWRNTSCMDTSRNGSGDCINQLPPNLLDSTLAVAYLTTSENDELFSPRYEARLLVRVIKVTDNDYLLVGFRPFYTNNTTKNYLIEGLKAKFDNFVQCDDLRSEYSDLYGSHMSSFSMYTEVGWSHTGIKVSCDDCDGDGTDWDDEECSTCEGTGYVSSYDDDPFYPYVDDPEFLEFFEDRVEISLPKEYLIAKGYMEAPKKEVSPSTASLAS
ncbi:hypothetical protein [Bacillus tequilensis]|uniref:hypothetical protein n=1 Tax=Bacillus tequilensis TaxID=227866 RepID=UPI0004633BF1|nr:hypothetical protein [Bacillus tequilensis]MDR4436198.1 hypothetical protein [Bacillus tequilensis]SPT93305.1 Uncharacterised protein [Bacillus tequilensis]SPU01165.1 Uncharacterised protein [Bacillus tequilensis]